MHYTAHLEGTTLLVVFDEVALAELRGRGVDEVGPPLLQETVALQVIRVQPVQLRRPQHADVEVGIA